MATERRPQPETPRDGDRAARLRKVDELLRERDKLPRTSDSAALIRQAREERTRRQAELAGAIPENDDAAWERYWAPYRDAGKEPEA